MTQVQTVQFEKVRAVTLPLFKIVPNAIIYVRSDSPMFIGKELKESKGNAEKKKEPATLMKVTNLMTGEQGQIICGTVLRDIFNDEYPTDSYVGKCFSIEMHKVPGKDYNGYSVSEVRVKAPDTEAPATEQTTAPATAPTTAPATAPTTAPDATLKQGKK